MSHVPCRLLRGVMPIRHPYIVNTLDDFSILFFFVVNTARYDSQVSNKLFYYQFVKLRYRFHYKIFVLNFLKTRPCQ